MWVPSALSFRLGVQVCKYWRHYVKVWPNFIAWECLYCDIFFVSAHPPPWRTSMVLGHAFYLVYSYIFSIYGGLRITRNEFCCRITLKKRYAQLLWSLSFTTHCDLKQTGKLLKKLDDNSVTVSSPFSIFG